MLAAVVGTILVLAAAGIYLITDGARGSGAAGNVNANTPAHGHGGMTMGASAGTASAGTGTVAASGAASSGVDVYAHARAGMFSPVVRDDPAYVYVPNLADGTVSVIDQKTLTVIRTYATGREPQHVVPSWDLRTLWVNNNSGNSLSPIDPRTGRLAGPSVPVIDPYNLYFTPDGRYAMVIAEANHDIDFRDPHTMALRHSLDVGTQCAGVNHVDFSPDGSYAIATCEFAGRLVKIDIAHQSVIGYLDLGRQSAPQDIKIDPAGKVWYVADMNADGVHLLDGDHFVKIGFVHTGPETHGLYPSRDGRFLYVANRGGQMRGMSVPFPHSGDAGSVSVISFATQAVVANWSIPGGGTPDMGNVSADGTRLWLSGRRSNVVYVFDTGGSAGADPSTGRLLTKIPVGREPHGLTVWPQPGRYSLGHTGIMR
ncbi:YNCE-like beta-propeller domain-containing protein [Frankia sp. AiPs1]|uniref:YncE family protein n=1 Tax=Frankia sp. AiPa1 TaxID=573492 RepID=UPI00202B6A06|nr:YncE family protein [Frankia sp. AiPa1]MCL9762253.1 YncE family protein [Frankia sp. AiPa1]